MKAVIFDLDGVIVHTDKFHYLAWKALADELGIYFDEIINNRCRGVSRMESLEVVLERSPVKYSAEQKAAFAERKNNLYREYLATMSQADVSDEVRQTLALLKRSGVKIAIGSSSKNAKLILQNVGLAETFDAVSDGNNITHSKPHPEVFLKAAEMLDVSPSDCAVVEDAVSGVNAGKAADMTTIAIGDAALSDIADYKIRRFSQIAAIVLGKGKLL